jgi:hypothetical protein
VAGSHDQELVRLEDVDVKMVKMLTRCDERLSREDLLLLARRLG